MQIFHPLFKKGFLHNFLLLCIIATALLKLSLVGNGFLAFPDEWRHIASGHVLKEVQAGNFHKAIETIFSTQGRPVDTLIKIIPNGMQYVSAKIFGLEYYESANSFPLFLFNFLIFCLTLFVHFNFSKLILKDTNLSLFSVLIFGSLVNSYIYLRHGLPYDTSLFILYIVFYKVVKLTQEKKFSYRKVFLLGFFAFFGYLAYPAYLLLYAIIGLIFFFNDLTKDGIISRIKYSLMYILGSISCFALFELTSRMVGTSYLKSSQELSETLNQGSFEECFSFLFKYLFEVEKVAGVLLIIGLIAFVGVSIFKIKKIETTQLIFITITFIFLLFAGAGYFFEKVILTGRILHQFIPFICIFFVYVIHEILKRTEILKVTTITLSLIFIGNFIFQFIEYKKYAYPRDVSWRYYKQYYPKEITDFCEMGNSWSVMPITNIELEKFNDRSTEHRITIINACTIFPFEVESYSEFKPTVNQKMIFSESSYINFKGYQFEGKNIEERKNVDSLNLPVKIFIDIANNIDES